MLYLIEKDGKYSLPYNVWILVKLYTGVYNLSINFNAVNNVRVDLLYGLYRDWFGRFILPDYYDFWDHRKRRKWLLKNLVEKNNYKMTEERYNKLIVASNSPLNLIE